MNKFFVQFALVAILGLFIQHASALQCYSCAPSADCNTNFMNSMKDCSQDLLAQGGSYVTGQKMVCAKFGIGNYVTRGCFIDGVCSDKPQCATCDSDLCNASETLQFSKISLVLTAAFAVFLKCIF